MTWKNRLVRLSRALSDMTQSAFAARAGVDRVLLAHYERGRGEPGPEHLKSLTQAAGLTLPEGRQILEYADALRRPRQRTGQGIETLRADLAALVSRVYERLLRWPPPGDPSGTGEQERAAELWSLLENLTDEQRLAVVRVAREFQSPALAERVRAEAEAAGDPERAAALTRLVREIEGEE